MQGIHSTRGTEEACKTDIRFMSMTNAEIQFVYIQTQKTIGWPEGKIPSAPGFQKEFYLVNDADRQYFVIVFDEFIESRQLSKKITARKFEIDNFSFVDCGVISEADTKS